MPHNPTADMLVSPSCPIIIWSTIENDGGYQAGKYFKELGHKKALCIADNFICMDKERIEGFRKAFEPGETLRWQIPKTQRERKCFYQDNFQELLKSNVTAVFAVSDFYALEFMRFLQGKGIQIPKDIQIIGFDDNTASRESNPLLRRFIRMHL